MKTVPLKKLADLLGFPFEFEIVQSGIKHTLIAQGIDSNPKYIMCGQLNSGPFQGTDLLMPLDIQARPSNVSRSKLEHHPLLRIVGRKANGSMGV